MSPQNEKPNSELPKKRYVKFYGANDGAAGWELEGAKKIIDELNGGSLPAKLCEAIELYNIAQYIESGIALESWSEDDTKQFQSKNALLQKMVADFFGSVTAENLISEASSLQWEYQRDLFILFEKYKLKEKISNEDFEKILTLDNIGLSEVLKSKYLVKSYAGVVKKSLLSDARNAEIIIADQTTLYKDRREGIKNKIYLPETITEKEIDKLVYDYAELPTLIEGPEYRTIGCNPNYLQVIPRMQKQGKVKISDSTKVKAANRYEEYRKSFFREGANGGIKIAVALYDSKAAFDEARRKSDEGDIRYDDWYDGEWLRSYTDWATVGNNFIYTLRMFLPDMQMTLPAYPSEISILLDTLGIKTKRQYRKGEATDLKWQLALWKLASYRKLLAEKNVKIENIIPWFFATYLKKEFGIKGYSVDRPLLSGKTSQKIKNLLPELDKVLKEYRLLVENETISAELLNMGHDVLPFNSVPSKNNKKYVYLNSENDYIQGVIKLLYSDQSSITCTKGNKIGKHFVDLLKKHNPKIDEFYDHQKKHLEFLQGQKIIKINNGKIIFIDPIMIGLLGFLYSFNGLCYYRVSERERGVLDKMLNRGLLVAEATLFSREEADFLNYVFNNSKFDNGPSIRNDYLHGSTVGYSKEQHESNYLLLLLCFILVLVKINDDLCIANGEMGPVII